MPKWSGENWLLPHTYHQWLEASRQPNKPKRPVPKQVLPDSLPIQKGQGASNGWSHMARLLFPLTPSKYLYTIKGHCPFWLQYVEFQIGGTHNATSIPIDNLTYVTLANLNFTMQKNGIPGEVINLLCSQDNQCYCPIHTLLCWVWDLWEYHINMSTSLYTTYYDTHIIALRISKQTLMIFLHIAAALQGLDVITTADTLHCTGTSTLLQGDMPVKLIKLLGH